MLTSHTTNGTTDGTLPPGTQEQRAPEAIKRVLLVQNDVAGTTRLASFLASCAVRIEVADTGEGALAQLRYREFDAVVLNLTLPDMSGTSMIRSLRQARNETPVVALCSSPKVQAKLDAFAAGADDVVDQSTNSIELLARIRAIVRRSRGYREPTLRAGNLTLHTDRRVFTVNGREVDLTAKEFAILEVLIVRKNTFVTREGILNRVYGGIDEPELQTIGVFLCKIRKKLAAAGAPDVIHTVRERGYMIRDAARDSSRPVLRSTHDEQLSEMLRGLQQAFDTQPRLQSVFTNKASLAPSGAGR
jgi:two-component system, cell cycle response regulator CtrA